jgi:hypothetical protein
LVEARALQRRRACLRRGNSSDSFFYNWSELTLAPVDHVPVRTRDSRRRARTSPTGRFNEERILGFNYKKLDLTAYLSIRTTTSPRSSCRSDCVFRLVRDHLAMAEIRGDACASLDVRARGNAICDDGCYDNREVAPTPLVVGALADPHGARVRVYRADSRRG